ncbi:PREDICTED: uncharacterized protein LOC109162580 [Ipomoea nil]|uniref:uncharacterized protein LOC109162580 n=1 Tax=Ipomoea nil TaxID=35883 RepID=UPI000900E08A|nr:PREDICTED: uncharacterized protein LOC109162580 [Ipomoea nil]
MNFDHETDFQRCWLRKSWSIKGSLMRVFKWTPDFRPEYESPIVPVWISLEGLTAHLHEKRAIYSIANLIGSPLKVDASTLSHNRPSTARVCVELDVSTSPTDQIWINNGSYGGFSQRVTYEYTPLYCLDCRRFGHVTSECRTTKDKPLNELRREALGVTDQRPSRQPLLVPPRKRWHPAPQATAQLVIQKASVDSQNELEAGSTAPLVIPTVTSLEVNIIDDQGIRHSQSSDTQPGHLSEGDEVQNAQSFTPSLLDS